MYRNYHSDSQSTKIMTEEQFERVVDAISSGKYSWACLLILRFAGYNPLHYIPHRTYNRLMKSYRENKLEQAEKIPVGDLDLHKSGKSKKYSQRLHDLSHLNEIDPSLKPVKGGMGALTISFVPNVAVRNLKQDLSLDRLYQNS